MNPKVLATVVLLVISASSFALLGVAALPGSPLSVAGGPAVKSGCSGCLPDLPISVPLSGFASSNGYYVSAYLPNGSSSPITFGAEASPSPASSGQCDPTLTGGGAAWAVGYPAYGGTVDGSAYAYFIITVTSGVTGALEPIGQVGGPTYIAISENASKALAWCQQNYYSNQQPYTSTGGGATYFTNTVYLPGNYTDNSILRVDFYTSMDECNYGPTKQGQSTPCATASANANTPTANAYYIGSAGVDAYAEAVLHSGYSHISPPTQSKVVNGGQMTIPYSTGWTDGSGFQLRFQTPSVRGPVATLGTITLQDDAVSSATFNIPANASQAPPQPCANGNSYCYYNVFSVVLFSDKWAIAVQTINVLISPNSGPANATIGFSDLSGHSPVIQGDQIEVSVTALATSASGSVTSINIGGYYNLGEPTPPVADSYWLFGNPAGQSANLTHSGNTTTGTITFEIGTVAPLTVVGQICTAKAQCQAVIVVINPVPANCANAGGMFCKTTGSALQTLGALLLSIGIAGLALAAVVWIPGPMLYRIGAAVVIVIGVALLYVFAFFPYFSMGGPI